MADRQTDSNRSAAQLRLAFDRGFALAIQTDTTVWEDYLLIRLHGAAHALRLSDVSRVQRVPWVTPVPGPVAALIGVAGLAGSITPVYDLRALLGHAVSQSPHWMVVTRQASIALAFDMFERHVRCPRGAVVQHAGGGTRLHVQAHLQTQQETLPIVDVVSVLDQIQCVARQCAQQQER